MLPRSHGKCESRAREMTAIERRLPALVRRSPRRRVAYGLDASTHKGNVTAARRNTHDHHKSRGDRGGGGGLVGATGPAENEPMIYTIYALYKSSCAPVRRRIIVISRTHTKTVFRYSFRLRRYCDSCYAVRAAGVRPRPPEYNGPRAIIVVISSAS